ncbi:hypothetical protein SAMN02949497_3197 [Methylomagnum ishizawai]|uniref:Uncharacterized protein n=1 Tax=Methylomagnum ishizawai TaxID=1760988 RepID=A0A1Y6D5J6_9GAMM|nr:hypothetical protein [Methylomagnum ishizawai]SMF95822.1 hypothetical protein SAMN02949497_3197 [Methylomagnum ishizawai]
MKQNQLVRALALAGLGFGGDAALAHVCNVDIGSGEPTLCGDSPQFSVYTPTVDKHGAVVLPALPNPFPAGFTGDPNCPYGGTDASGNACVYGKAGLINFSGYGWLMGTTPLLGDSHNLHGGTFFTFTLAESHTVRITLAGDTYFGNGAGLDPAFSLYAGRLPDDAHDGVGYDSTDPVDDSCGLPIASKTDQAPGDPGIPQYLVDPDTCVASPNPAFTVKVQRQYAKLYRRPNGPYRDTLNYIQTGGLDETDNPLHLFNGQFNAKGGWSMANEDAIPGDPSQTMVTNPDGTRATYKPLPDGSQELVWSELRFIKAKNAHTGPQMEAMTIALPAGHYTVAASGANCNDQSIACVAPHYGGKITFKIIE